MSHQNIYFSVRSISLTWEEALSISQITMSGFMELFVGDKVRNISIDSLFHSEPILCGQLRRRTLARFKVDPKNDERHVEKHGDNSSESIKTHITYNLQVNSTWFLTDVLK